MIQPPEINYMNIYTQQTKRLRCFQAITEKYVNGSFLENGEFYPSKQENDKYGGYFYGDATAYEKFLDQQLK